MLSKRWSACAAAALLYGGTAAAQQPGTLLLGGFGQYTIFDDGLKQGGEIGTEIVDNKFGYGGRIGAFFARNWALEAEASYTEAETGLSSNPMKYGPIAARLVYGLPIYGRTSLLFGAGGVITPFHNDVGSDPGATGTNFYNYMYGVTGDVGLRIMLGDYFAVRGDAIADYMPTDPSFVNYRFQAGLEVMPDFSSMMGMGSMAPASFSWWDEQPQPLPGTVELHGFGQYTYYDSKLNFDRGFNNSLGYGAGLGVFLTRNWEVEGEGSYTNPSTRDAADASTGSDRIGGPTPAGTNYDNGRFALRANYNFPVGSRSSFIVGAGAVRSSFHGSDDVDNNAGAFSTYSFGPEGLVGFRLGLANRIALRLDALVDYPVGDLETYNYTGRVGLSFMLGGASRAVVDTTPYVTPPPPPPPAPAPVEPPPPPPAQVMVDTTKITAPIFFDFDKSDLRSDAQATLDAKIPYLQANPGMRIRIEGNTDERGSDEYNLALGQRRSASAKQYLVQHGIDAGRIDIVSYGEERPVCDANNEECYQQNRRDDFRILVIGSDAIQAPQM